MAAKDSAKRKSASSSDGGLHKKSKSSHGNKKASTNPELSSSAQKRQVRKERQSHRRHADTVAEAKVLWNKLRMKSNTVKDTKELMEKVMELIRGKVAEIALQHDASRVVQAAVQFGNEEQRRELLTEICASEEASLVELAKIQYAHFCCLKFIKYCGRDEEALKMIVKVSEHEHGICKQRPFAFFSDVSSLFPVVSRRNSQTGGAWCCGSSRRIVVFESST
jgi:pumilio family protein 6